MAKNPEKQKNKEKGFNFMILLSTFFSSSSSIHSFQRFKHKKMELTFRRENELICSASSSSTSSSNRTLIVIVNSVSESVSQSDNKNNYDTLR